MKKQSVTLSVHQPINALNEMQFVRYNSCQLWNSYWPWIVLCKLYFIVFFKVPLLVDILIVRMSTVCATWNTQIFSYSYNPLNAELNPICYLLALLAHHFLHVSRIRVKSLTLRLLMSYIYIWSAYSWCF